MSKQLARELDALLEVIEIYPSPAGVDIDLNPSDDFVLLFDGGSVDLLTGRARDALGRFAAFQD